jgi:tetratricopeptide (TPR) repeat protein
MEEIIMTRKSVRGKISTFMCLCVGFVCVSSMFISCGERKVRMTVQEAFELRMNGMADSAKAGLQLILDEHPANAAAWFELARTEHHMGLGNPRELFGRLQDIQLAIGHAVKNEPGNVIYSFYRGYFSFLTAYASFMRQDPDALGKAKEAVSALESVLSLKPDYYEAALYLVEILSVPAEMGGDSARAEAYAVQLEEIDAVIGAKARELCLPKDVDRVEFWQEVLANTPNNADVLEQLGKAHLYKDDVEQGTNYLEEALQIDPRRSLLLLDLARYHIITARRDAQLIDTALPLAEELINRYLSLEPIPPLKAYALGMSAMIESVKGNREGADELRKQAAAVDPHFSKASGVPPFLLYTAPDEVAQFHSYFFRPL